MDKQIEKKNVIVYYTDTDDRYDFVANGISNDMMQLSEDLRQKTLFEVMREWTSIERDIVMTISGYIQDPRVSCIYSYDDKNRDLHINITIGSRAKGEYTYFGRCEVTVPKIPSMKV